MAILSILSLPTMVMHSLTKLNPLCAATDHYGCQIHRQLKCAPKSSTQIRSDTTFTQSEILALAVHSGPISAETAGELCRRCEKHRFWEEDAEQRMPSLLCSHDNTLQSSSCQLPPDCLIAPDSAPRLRLSTQITPLPLITESFFQEERSV